MHMVLGIRGCSGDWGKGGLDGDLTTKGDIYSLITNSSSMKILNDDESASQIREFREGQASEQYWTYQAAIARSMGTWASSTDVPPSFVLAVGDNFYTKGVYSTDDPLWETYWKEVYLDNYESLRIPWLPALGNHDYGYGMDGVYAQIEKTNEDAENGYLWQFPSQYYTRRFSIPGGGSLQIIVIDSTTLAPSENQCCNEKGGVSEEEQQERISEQLASIESMLQEAQADPPTWLLVAGHYPTYSEGDHGDTDELVTYLQPLLEKYRVNAYLSGHDHISEHLQYNDIEYFVCGAGALTDKLGRGGSVASLIWYGAQYSAFCTFEATRDSLTVQFIDSTGDIKYSYSLSDSYSDSDSNPSFPTPMPKEGIKVLSVIAVTLGSLGVLAVLVQMVNVTAALPLVKVYGRTQSSQWTMTKSGIATAGTESSDSSVSSRRHVRWDSSLSSLAEELSERSDTLEGRISRASLASSRGSSLSCDDGDAISIRSTSEGPEESDVSSRGLLHYRDFSSSTLGDAAESETRHSRSVSSVASLGRIFNMHRGRSLSMSSASTASTSSTMSKKYQNRKPSFV